jgi:hypothetical protein
MKKGKINMLEVLSFCKENIVGLEVITAYENPTKSKEIG